MHTPNTPASPAKLTLDGHLIKIVGLWLIGALIATFFAAMQADSAIWGDLYFPRTNDSFYHARRILDAAVGERGLVQFDERLHPPDGTLVPWPWAYDYLLAKLTQLALWIRPDMAPMAFLSWFPVAWTCLNAALFLGAASAAGLSLQMRALAMLAFALSPLTQLLHSVAMIDHHYVEFSFVLAVSWLAMAWMNRPGSRRLAAGLGLVLGCAPAFHVGLFLLQLIPLVTILILWLRRKAPPRDTLIAFAVTLVVFTQLILLPSLAYRQGIFDYAYLSWFHIYLSAATATMLVLVGYLKFSGRMLGVLTGIAIALSVPMLTNFFHGAAFLTGNVSILPDITETFSPFRFNGGDSLSTSYGISYHSWLLLTVPALIIWYGYHIFRESVPKRLCFAVIATLGLVLLSLQFRFHYYGLFAMIAGGLLVIEGLQQRFRWHQGMAFVAALGILYLAYQPPLRNSLFTIYAMAADPMYQGSIPIHLELENACEEDPGLILANHDDGNSLLYHTNCSVLANNFILGASDEAKFAEIDRLMRLAPADLLAAEQQVKYLFIRANDFGFRVNGKMELERSSAIVSELLLSESIPDGFELLTTSYTKDHPDAEPEPHAWLFRLTRNLQQPRRN